MSLEKQRLLWQARRGMLELDIVLKNFIDHNYDDLDQSLQNQFKDLLVCSDQELYDWLVKKESADNNMDYKKYLGIINAIRK